MKRQVGSIALADDEDIVRNMNKFALSIMFPNAQIKEAKSGLSLVQLVESGFKPELIVTDYNMPYMRGVEALRKIRQLGVESPALIVTGNVYDLEQEGISFSLKRDNFYELPHEYNVKLLTKPYTLQEFKEALNNIL